MASSNRDNYGNPKPNWFKSIKEFRMGRFWDVSLSSEYLWLDESANKRSAGNNLDIIHE